MKRKKKICIITGSRAEYGLLYWLIKGLKEDGEFIVKLIATGMHLKKEFGLTYKEIEKDFILDEKIDILLNDDTSVGILKSMSIAQVSFARTFKKIKPNLVILLGDRFEIFSVASAAMISKVPIVHIHGGELTVGSWDDNIRHSITKMSHLHFTASEDYKKRVIQLGEHPSKVFNVGALGIESIKKLKLQNKKKIEKSIGFRFFKKNLLVTFHPCTNEKNTAAKHFKELLSALDELKDTKIIFTKSNSDTDGRIINKLIDIYVKKNNKKTIAFTSLGQLRYLSIMQYVDAVVGNSSSGLIEAPSFKIGTINIGDRQKGRIKAKSIIECPPKKEKIKNSFKLLYSKKFQSKLKNLKNPYDNGLPSINIIKILKNIELDNILKKVFYDINLK